MVKVAPRSVFDAHPRPWQVIPVDSPSAGNGAWARVVSAHGGIIASAPTPYAEVIVQLVNRDSNEAPAGGRFELSCATAHEQHQLAIERALAAQSETSRHAAEKQVARWELVEAVLWCEDRARARWESLGADASDDATDA